MSTTVPHPTEPAIVLSTTAVARELGIARTHRLFDYLELVGWFTAPADRTVTRIVARDAYVRNGKRILWTAKGVDMIRDRIVTDIDVLRRSLRNGGGLGGKMAMEILFRGGIDRRGMELLLTR
jgi:hypothetical protein